ncbi:hypothetical protein [Amycolatopsis benzoatilytica]|uniref:hypothetical protein n=1 Tax=Amycolatopsis benzoatilytica TaxID=346045 RepID=UPI00035C1A12|nr:hypothetical protein [Amycolatopsis benzoatilytica]
MIAQPPAGRAKARSDVVPPRSRTSADATRILVAGIAVSATITLMAGMAATIRSAPASAPSGVTAPQAELAPSGLPLAPATGPAATTSRAS